VGSECGGRCDIDKQYNSAAKKGNYLWKDTTNTFKNFDTTDATGFTSTLFLGRYIKEDTITLSEEGHKSQLVNQLHLFVIHKPIDNL